MLEQIGAKPIEEPDWTLDPLSDGPTQVFVDRVGRAILEMQALGIEPAVILWSGRASFALRYRGPPHESASPTTSSTHEVKRTTRDGVSVLSLHGAPILQRHTPRGRCYVAPRRAVETLTVQAGNLGEFDVKADWADPRDSSLQVEVMLTVSAEFKTL